MAGVLNVGIDSGLVPNLKGLNRVTDGHAIGVCYTRLVYRWNC